MPTTASPAATTAPDASQRLDEGLAASQAGDSGRANELFGQAQALAPAWHLPPFLLGSENAAMGDFERAEGYFAQTVLLAPDFPIARYQLGLLQFSGGRTHLAMLTWGPLGSLPEGDSPFPHLVQGFGALARGDLDAARRHFESGLPLASSNQGLQADVARVLGALKEQAGAERPAAPDAGAPPAADNAASHVLLSNYANGTVH